MPSSRFLNRAIVLALLASVFLNSCRFKLPSVNEGQVFKRSGAFTTEVPGWVNQNRDEAPELTTNSGVLPLAAGTSASVEQSRASLPTGAAAVQGELQHKIKKGSEERNKAKIAEGNDQIDDNSPLGRIEAVCPGLESDVSDSLTTTDTESRIRKYESLTRRCPDSADLWLWLGKDYQSEKRLAEASRCFERVLLIDGSNEVAQALLSVVKKELNKTSSGSAR